MNNVKYCKYIITVCLFYILKYVRLTCGLGHASLSDVFGPWNPTTFRAGLFPVFVAPFPVWMGLKVGLLHLGTGEEKRRKSGLKKKRIPKYSVVYVLYVSAETFSHTCPLLNFLCFLWLQMHLFTWKAKSWYFCFSLGPRAYHHSPRILLTVLLSWFGCRWCTSARWRLLKIINAFIGRRMWSFSLWKSMQETQETLHYIF